MQHLLRLEADVGILPRTGLEVLDLDLVDHLHAAGGLARLRLVGREAAHEFLQFGDLVLGTRIRRGLTRLRFAGRQHVVVVVARVDLDGAEVQIGHVGTDLIQEMAVVRDDDDGGVALVQHVFQPADGVDVEVVGRFVEQQDVGAGEQRLRQQHAQLEARRDLAHGAVVLFGGDADAEQQLAGARLGVVAAHLAEPRFEFGGVQVVFFGSLRVHVDGVLLLHHAPHLDVPLHHHIEHPLIFVGKLVLPQPGHALAGVERDVAGSRLQLAGEDFHEGGFAAAVGADQAVAVAVAELDVDVLEQGFGGKLQGDAGSGEHGSVPGIREKPGILPPRGPRPGWRRIGRVQVLPWTAGWLAMGRSRK